MPNEELTTQEAVAFSERLNSFGERLSPKEHDFLKAILCDAESAPDENRLSLGGAEARTLGEILVAIHRASLSPAISLNPQPIPTSLNGFTDAPSGGV